MILYFGTCYALLAQMDRVTGYEPVGRGFESLTACHQTLIDIQTISVWTTIGVLLFHVFFTVLP